MNSDTQWLRAEVLPLPKTPPRMCESNSVWTVMIYVIPQLQLKCTTVIVKRGQRRHITGGRISCTADLITASLQRPRRLSKVRLKCWVIQFTLILHDAHTLITLLNKQRSASREQHHLPGLPHSWTVPHQYTLCNEEYKPWIWLATCTDSTAANLREFSTKQNRGGPMKSWKVHGT